MNGKLFLYLLKKVKTLFVNYRNKIILAAVTKKPLFIMKKFLLCLVFMSAMTLTSCSSDDDSDTTPETNSDLVGTWEITDLNYQGSSTTSFQGQEISLDFSGQSISFQDAQVVFNADNTYESSGSATIEFTVETMGQSQTQELSTESGLETGTWEINGQQLLLTPSGQDQQVSDIDVFTDSDLKISIDNFTASGFPNGAAANATIDAEYSLHKL